MKQNPKPEINIQKLLKDMERNGNLKDGPKKFSNAILNGQKQESAVWYNPDKSY